MAAFKARIVGLTLLGSVSSAVVKRACEYKYGKTLTPTNSITDPESCPTDPQLPAVSLRKHTNMQPLTNR
jgi:hypothetical protein